MKKILILLLLPLLFLSCPKKESETDLYSEETETVVEIIPDEDEVVRTPQINESRWVNTRDGLRMRDTPDTAGEVIVTVPGGAEVLLVEETGDFEVIDGRSGKWSRIIWEEYDGWVFGGYLSGTMPRYTDFFPVPADRNRGYQETLPEERYPYDYFPGEIPGSSVYIIAEETPVFREVESFSSDLTLRFGDTVTVSEDAKRYVLSDGIPVIMLPVVIGDETGYVDARDCLLKFSLEEDYISGIQLGMNSEIYITDEWHECHEEAFLLVYYFDGQYLFSFNLTEGETTSRFHHILPETIIRTDKNGDGIPEIVITGDLRGGKWGTAMGGGGPVELWVNYQDPSMVLIQYYLKSWSGDEYAQQSCSTGQELSDTDNDGFYETITLIRDCQTVEYAEDPSEEDRIIDRTEYITTYEWDGQVYLEVSSEERTAME